MVFLSNIIKHVEEILKLKIIYAITTELLQIMIIFLKNHAMS
jgi:hypothetical protein